MPVELRKRPAPKEDPAPAAKRSASKPRATATSKAKQVVEKAKALVTGEASTTTTTASAVPDSDTVGDSGKVPETVGAGTAGTEPSTTTTISTTAKAETAANTAPAPTTTSTATTPLSATSINHQLPPTALSTPILSHTGTSSTLSTLLSSSTNGIIIFTYPKASTPGCTTQACLFRDNYDDLRGKGYDVFGLSNDSEKANSSFKTKQSLQYEMLCDPDANLTGVLGMKKAGNAKGTLRGVVVLEKDGLVKVWFQGGPAKTLDAVKDVLG